MAKTYNLKNIAKLLDHGFNEDELRALCLYEPDFKPVYNQIKQDDKKQKIILQIIEYAEQKNLIDSLLDIVKDENAASYEKYEPYDDSPILVTGQELPQDKLKDSQSRSGPGLNEKIQIKQWQAEAGYIQIGMQAYSNQLEEKLQASAISTPGMPYKGLIHYEMTDEQIFFGREQQIEQLLERIKGHRLTVLHGISGVGKTSLINAGLTPRLLRNGAVPLHPLPGLGTAYQSPEPPICKRIINAAPFDPNFAHLSEVPLHQFLRFATPGLNGKFLVIFLDRFEDFFIHLRREARNHFIAEFAKCYDDQTLPVKFVISIRKEYFSDLYEFESVIPTVFYNQFKLEPLRSEQAHQAIYTPAARLSVYYEPALIEAIIDDLGRENVELPQLQIVCEQLYEKRRDRTITLAEYEQRGRAHDILASHLGLVMDRFGQHRSLAKHVLMEFITTEGAKQSLTREKLGLNFGKEEVLDEVLNRLVNYRLLRGNEHEGVFQYELAHEYLIKEIREWFGDEQLRLKEVKELLDRELSNWRIFGTLINPDRLQILEEWSATGRLTLSQEAQELIETSRHKQTLDEQEQLQVIQSAKITSLDQMVLGIDHEISSPIACIRSDSRFLRRSVGKIKHILERLPEVLIKPGEDWPVFGEDIDEDDRNRLRIHMLQSLEMLGQDVDRRLSDEGVWTILAKIDEISEELGQAADKMADLVKALSSFVQPAEARPKPTDIHVGLETALLLLGYELKYNMEVKRRYTGSLLKISGFPNQLVQLFMNILMNSVEAIKAKQTQGLDGVIKIETYRDGSWGGIIISDNGAGMSPENIEKIFRPGFTTKGLAHRGLGLSIVDQIVQRHQGAIEVNSELKRGTIVKVQLPMMDAEDNYG